MKNTDFLCTESDTLLPLLYDILLSNRLIEAKLFESMLEHQVY